MGTIGEGEATTTGDLTLLFHEEVALDARDLFLEELEGEVPEILIVNLSLTPSRDEVAIITETTPHNCLEEEEEVVGVVVLEWGMDLEVEAEWDSLLMLQLAMEARVESLEWVEPRPLAGRLQITTNRMPTDLLLLGINFLIIGIPTIITRMLYIDFPYLL